MRGQNGAAGEVIDLLAQKTGGHPLGAVEAPKKAGDGTVGTQKT